MGSTSMAELPNVLPTDLQDGFCKLLKYKWVQGLSQNFKNEWPKWAIVRSCGVHCFRETIIISKVLFSMVAWVSK